MKIEKSELAKALEAVRPAISSKGVIEQADHVVLDGGYIHACDDFTAITMLLSPPWEGDPIAVLAAPLLELLARLPDGEVDLTVADDELRVKAGRIKAGIAIQTEIKMIRPAPPKKKLPLPPGFVKAINGVTFCVAKGMADPRLSSLRCEGEVVLGGDNLRFAEYGAGGEFPLPFSLPSPLSKAVIKAVPKRYGIGDGWLWFFGEYTIAVRAWDQEYPTKQIMGFFEVKGEQVELPEDLAVVVERAGILAGDDIVQDKLVELSFAGGKLTVRGQGVRGWVEERMRVEWNGERKLMISPYVLSAAAKLSRTVVMGERIALFSGQDWRHIVALEEGEEK